MPPTTTQPPAVATPKETPEGHFIALLSAKTSGVTLEELDAKLARVVRAVLETGKSGTLTYTIKVKRNDKRGIKVIDECKIKEPEEERGETFLYATHWGRVMRNNPEGPDLPGLVVSINEEPAKVVTL